MHNLKPILINPVNTIIICIRTSTEVVYIFGSLKVKLSLLYINKRGFEIVDQY